MRTLSRDLLSMQLISCDRNILTKYRFDEITGVMRM